MPARKRKAVGTGGGGSKKPRTADGGVTSEEKTTLYNEVGTSKKRKSKERNTTRGDMRVTRFMKFDAPRQAVISTTELLEKIMLYLPPKKVFVVQRVSRRFRDVVAESTAIQQKLFLKPRDPERTPWVLRMKVPSSLDIPPNVSSTWFGNFFFAEAKDANDNGSVQNLGQLAPVTANPLLCTFNHWQGYSHRFIERKGEKIPFNLNRPVLDPGSWRDMYISDPPCTSASFVLWWYPRNHSRLYWAASSDLQEAHVSNVNGLKFGDLMQAALSKNASVSPYSNIQGSLESFIRERERKGRSSSIDQTAMIEGWPPGKRQSSITLHGVVVPTEREWETLR